MYSKRDQRTKIYYAKQSVEQLRDAMESVPTSISDEVPMWEGNEDEKVHRCRLRKLRMFNLLTNF